MFSRIARIAIGASAVTLHNPVGVAGDLVRKFGASTFIWGVVRLHVAIARCVVLTSSTLVAEKEALLISLLVHGRFYHPNHSYQKQHKTTNSAISHYV
eukprot:COSAG01_NODE_35969_length_524_cov_0.936471_1_plen_97_part_10